MRKLAWAVIASLVALTGPAVGTVDESSGTVTAAPPAPEDQTGTVRRIVFSDGLQQKASGELAIVNLDGNSYSQDLSTLSLFDLCVRNYRSTPASSVWVEVWASTQIPQIGGDLTHFTVATYAFGLVNGYSTRCQDTGAIPMTAPNPGQYWISVVVYEGSGTGRTLQFVYTDTEKSDFGGHSAASTCTCVTRSLTRSQAVGLRRRCKLGEFRTIEPRRQVSSSYR